MKICINVQLKYYLCKLVFGNVVLTSQEKDLLSLGPGFMVMGSLSQQEMDVESAVTMTKVRWSRRKKGVETLTEKQAGNEYEPLSEEQETLAETLETEARDVLGPNGEEIDMRRKRPTDMQNNREVKMPGPAPAQVEAEYNARVGVWSNTFKKFKNINCREDGTQNKTNLTLNQVLGLRTLSRKVAKLEIIITEADKGKKFVAMDEETYLKMARDHTDKDVVTTPAEVCDSQHVLSATARSIGAVLGLGKSQSRGSHQRCMENCGSSAEDVPNLKVLPKVHKPLGPSGHPQSRPVVAAASGLSSRAGDAVADFLEPLVDVEIPRMEDRSTEEVIAQLEEAQMAVRDAGLTDTMAGSLDVKALYPSLDHEESAEAVARFIQKSKVRTHGIDWRAAVVYLASNMTEDRAKEEKLLHLLPRRLKRRGARPGNTTLELGRSNQGEEEKNSKWAASDLAGMTEIEKKYVLSKVFKFAVLAVFHHHQYQFAGTTFRQADGAPIGLRLTSIIARIVMDEWTLRFVKVLLDNEVEIHLLAKYVDDLNLILGMLPLGTRWSSKNNKMECNPEDAAEDEQGHRTREEVTVEAVKDAANSIVPWLQFTADIPQYHSSGMVPILDLQVWVEHPSGDNLTSGLGPDTICWTYYEKKISSNKVMRAETAYPWRSKIVTLTMELFRRMRNSTRQLTTEARAGIVNDFTDKMHRSGYTKGAIRGILKSGLEYYYRKLEIDLQGGT